MNLAKAIEFLNKYKIYFQHSVLINEVNKEIGEFVENYALRKLLHVRDKLNEVDRNEFTKMIEKCGFSNKKVKKINFQIFMDFLNIFFNKVDEEERSSSASLELATTFRILVDLIVIIEEFENIPEEWLTKSNFMFI